MLREILQRKSNILYNKFIGLESNARRILEYAQGGYNISYTPHGLSHTVAVELNYEWLLSREDVEMFNAYEIFVLLAATYFHDALRAPRYVGDEKDAEKEHAKRAKEFITKNCRELGIQLNEAVAIGTVIQGHSVQDLRELDEYIIIGSEKVNIHKLSACLSIADICHADESRAPWIVKTHLEMDVESEYHWNRHLQISGITRDGNKLVMGAIVFSEEGEGAVKVYQELIENQLEICKPYFDTILTRIDSVDLSITHLQSILEQSFSFKSNMSEILKLLIDGVYSRDDVFIRELVQNCLDACLIARAKSFKSNIPYAPEILISLYTEDDIVKAVRIDDNGIGMNIRDIRDTLLWIGSSINKNTTVTNLVEEAMGKQLIATFGIGILSCFKVSQRIFVTSCKEGEQAVEINLSSISDTIIPKESEDTLRGTTFLIEIDNRKYHLDEIKYSLLYYFRDINQVTVKQMVLPYSETIREKHRDDMFKIAISSAKDIEALYDEFNRSHSSIDDFRDVALDFQTRFADKLFEKKICGDNYNGVFWLPDQKHTNANYHEKGRIEILNEGIFVQNDAIENWLPKHFDAFNGRLNFSAKVLDLTASRDLIKKNEKMERMKNELRIKSTTIFEALVQEQSAMKCTDIELSKSIITIYNKAGNYSDSLLNKMGNYRVRTVGNGTIELKEIKDEVYIEYPHGRYVEQLGVFDRCNLYKKNTEFVRLQSTLLNKCGRIVIKALRLEDDQESAEAALVIQYLKKKYIKAHDLTKENVINNLYRSRKINSASREILGTNVKFVDVTEYPEKKVWVIGDYIWVNISNEMMEVIYNKLNDPNTKFVEQVLIKAIIESLSYQFDEAIDSLFSIL